MPRKALLVCGVVSSVLYVAIDVLAAVVYGGYHSFTSRWISELGAVGAPTKHLVDPLFIVYDLLLIAFGVGVWSTAAGKRAQQIVGGLLIAIGAIGLPGPWLFPMHLRGSVPVSADAPHIAATGAIVLCIMTSMIAGAFALGSAFRVYSLVSLVVIVATGFVSGLQASALVAGEPARWMGLTERINIGAYLLWVAVLAVALRRREESPADTSSPTGGQVPTPIGGPVPPGITPPLRA